ncbi:MAG: sugar kinase, partial [Methanomassiliicoccales archaeon]
MKIVQALLHAIANEVEKAVKNTVNSKNLGEDLGIGADGTPTKLIDDMAEQICFKVLKEKKGKLNILSEEAGFIDNNAERTLVMDPIDGTHNAIKGIPVYAVSLAVGKNKLSDVEYGLVRNLVTGDTFWAEKGKGAYLNDRSIKVRDFNQEESMFALYVGGRATQRSYTIAKLPRRGRALGCASL